MNDGMKVRGDNNKFYVVDASALIPAEYDEIALTYTGDNITTAEYKLSGATVATLTITYDVNDNMTGVVRT